MLPWLQWRVRPKVLDAGQYRCVAHAFVLGITLAVLAFGSFARQRAAVDTNEFQSLSRTLPAQHAIVARAIPLTEGGSSDTSLASLLVNPLAKEAPVPQPQKPAPELKMYLVEDGDNPFDLAANFGISEETLLGANGLTDESTLAIGQKLLVPPVSGVVVSTQPGETVSGVASQWKIDVAKIIAVNNLNPNIELLIPGEALVLPGAAPAVEIRQALPAASAVETRSSAPASLIKPSVQSVVARPATSVVASPPNTRPAVARSSGGNNFPWGQCTWWAANSRPDIGSVVVGNAASWLYSARSAGLATGSQPRVGAIVVYQPGAQGAAWTGHVGYVTSVSSDNVHFAISEMNFPFWGVVTHRNSQTGGGVSFIY